MSVDDVCDWLATNGFSKGIQDAFIGEFKLILCRFIYVLCHPDEEMDGKAIQQAYATCSGPDCILDVISKFGQRLKVYNFIKKAIAITNPPPVSPPSLMSSRHSSQVYKKVPSQRNVMKLTV